jgi:hypothetical protein
MRCAALRCAARLGAVLSLIALIGANPAWAALAAVPTAVNTIGTRTGAGCLPFRQVDLAVDPD